MPAKEKNNKSPKLFSRGKKKILYYRLFANGKESWHSTGTADLTEAKSQAMAALAGMQKGKESLKDGVLPERVAYDISHSVSKKLGVVKAEIKIKDAFQAWKEIANGFDDLSVKTQKFLEYAFRQFAEWIEDKNIKFIEGVTRELAKKYSKHLWKTGLSPKSYNEHIKFLSRIFVDFDYTYKLPERNPFNPTTVRRKKKHELNTAGHKALEPDELKKVIDASVNFGEDYRDLFIIGANTGMRLKDAALLKWVSIKGDFIEIKPYKTMKSGNIARIPISTNLKTILDKRLKTKVNEYVIPGVADHYQRNPSCVIDRAKKIFENALGKDNTVIEKSVHRRRTTSICSFHSFRTSFLTMLAGRYVNTRDAMRMMGWGSPEMIAVYERELEKARGESDKRTLELVNSLDGLKYDIPEVPETRPSKEKLAEMLKTKTNAAIGETYGVSEAAVRKWVKKYNIQP